MTASLDAALSGMVEQQRNIELIANNLANVNTSGYKRLQVHFRDVLDTAQILAATQGNLPATSASTSAGVQADLVERVFVQGPLIATDQPFDMAIIGDGFFRVKLADGSVAYTRDGLFRIDSERRLVNPEGDLLDPLITLPATYDEVHVEADGKVVVRRSYTDAELLALPEDAPRDGVREDVGQILLARFDNPALLLSIGRGLYQATADTPPIDGNPLADGMGSVASGVLEGSNVEVADEMTSLLVATRTYQMNLQAYRSIQKMLEQAATLTGQ